MGAYSRSHLRKLHRARAIVTMIARKGGRGAARRVIIMETNRGGGVKVMYLKTAYKHLINTV